MSALAETPFGLSIGAFYDLDDVSEDVDWGSATPINTVAELELDHGIIGNALKRKSKRVSFSTDLEDEVPKYQRLLLLQGLRQPFVVKDNQPVPQIRRQDEIIVKIQAVGLNPIDWKSADFGYSIPILPYVSGRDFAGVVVKVPAGTTSVKRGDMVLCPSTDYRDLRKAAFQQYAIATTSTVCKLSNHVSATQGATLGVAYVAAALALGICFGLRLPSIDKSDGPDLVDIVRSTPLGRLPRDTVAECLIEDSDRPKPGDWLVIWGGSSTSALFLAQFARLSELKVILVLDTAKHGGSLPQANGCIFVDSHDTDRAIRIIKGLTGGHVRYGVDAVGTKTTECLAQCLAGERSSAEGNSHLVALAALPKARVSGIGYHAVPVKLFHEVPAIGLSLMEWLEKALEAGTLALPRLEEVSGGLEGINDALDRMRQGLVSGKRLVVTL